MSFLNEFVQWSPLVSICVFSLLINLVLTIAYRFLIDYKKYKEIQEKQKDLKKQLKENKDNIEKMGEINKEMMSIAGKSMKMTMKPMIITFIPLIITFGLMRTLYESTIPGGVILTWGATFPILGTWFNLTYINWFWSYFVLSIVFSTVFRKIFKLN